MNLIERLRSTAIAGEIPSHEAADEIERCWAEIEARGLALEESQAQAATILEALQKAKIEIERLKAAKDLDALARASQAGYQHGFRTAITTLWPVVGTLLKDHHHGEV